MTRTNRNMSEPPVVTLPGDDQAGGMVMLSAVIVAGMVLTFILAIAWAHHHYTQQRIDRLERDLRTLQTFATCDAPPKTGDTLVITIRRTPDQLATRCQLITNPMQPERAFQ